MPQIMINPQILEAIKQMPNVERLEMIEFALKLMREEIENPKKLSLTAAAEMMRSYYEIDSSLTEFVDTCNEDFYEYQDYA
ncbi:MAG: hypothetical protein ACLBM1_15390 [Cuspidothrix sp.]